LCLINEPKVAVVIVTFNRVKVLKSCLLSLLRNTYKNYEIIIVDNASTDDTAAGIRLLFPYVRLLRNEQNLGYTGGNNKGIEYALKQDFEYLLILNDDVAVDPNFLKNLVNVACSNPEIGIACPKVLCFETPNKLFKEYGKYNFYLGISYQPLNTINRPQETGLVPGASFLIKREVMQKIGLMDENFFLYFDEGDLCYRTREAGFKMMYVPSAIVYHKVSESFSGWTNPVVLYYSTRNELLLARKHLNLLLFIPLWIPRFVLRIVQYSITTRDLKPAKSVIKGFLDFTKGKFGKVSLEV
jgi:GT2 family glycosyltransferase